MEEVCGILCLLHQVKQVHSKSTKTSETLAFL